MNEIMECIQELEANQKSLESSLEWLEYLHEERDRLVKKLIDLKKSVNK